MTCNIDLSGATWLLCAKNLSAGDGEHVGMRAMRVLRAAPVKEQSWIWTCHAMLAKSHRVLVLNMLDIKGNRTANPA
jgi:hypothetical protein